MKSILLITHDTSLSGAPKSVLLVFEELRKRGCSLITVAIQGGGGLESRFKQISNQYYRLDVLSRKPSYTFVNRIKRKITGKSILSPYDDLIAVLSIKSFDYLYANTVLSLDFALVLKRILGCPLVLHVHELKTVIDEFQPELSRYDHEIALYFVPSKLNQHCLENDYGLPSKKIHLVREASEFVQSKVNEQHRFSLKTIVLMCGGAYWRKGDDLFIQVANQVLKKDPFYEFYWIGKQSPERKRVNSSDISKLGIKDSVFFMEETETPEKWYLQTDIFILTSREDSFPLAAIEAGMIGIPIICFDKATGISEVIDSELVVPYIDIEAMAKKILDLKLSPEKINEISMQNKKIFNQFRAIYIANDIFQLLENFK
jgi:glycosyltransferase involved in cell wall biosynthesis